MHSRPVKKTSLENPQDGTISFSLVKKAPDLVQFWLHSIGEYVQTSLDESTILMGC